MELIQVEGGVESYRCPVIHLGLQSKVKLYCNWSGDQICLASKGDSLSANNLTRDGWYRDLCKRLGNFWAQSPSAAMPISQPML